MNCIDCGAEKAPGRSRCWACYTAYRQDYEAQQERNKGLRILSIDIETAPNTVYTWGLWNVNVGINQIIESARMLCFAAKWLGEDEMIFASEWDYTREDMVGIARDLLDSADVVMHFNGQRFDVPHLNREMLQAGYTPPSPYKQIDLKNAVKRTFRFPSNKLQYITTTLGLEGKEQHEGFELWTKVMAGDREAQDKMMSYNMQDVRLLEELYHLLLPWIPQLPNRNLYGGEGCAACGSLHVIERGTYKTPLSIYPQYLCTSCGYWMRGNKRISGAEFQAAAL